MHELVNNYTSILLKLGITVAQDIKHKIKLLDPENPISHHRQQKMSDIKLKDVKIT